MLSLAEYRSGLCPLCGSPRELCQAEENSAAFIAPPPTRCHATTAIRQAARDLGGDYPTPEGLIWSAELRQPQ